MSQLPAALLSDVFRMKIVVCLECYDTLGEQFYNVGKSNVSRAIFITSNTDIEYFMQSEYLVFLLDQQKGKLVMEYIQKVGEGEPKSSRLDLSALGSLKIASWPDWVSPTSLKTDRSIGHETNYL
ncbi:hypothetical protein Tco_0954159 [Tanacetum coccineum]|uniref:Uncharacterized protein n=1 Tax=Tanacetum coccineum TaxID=301880 RepID=A0ABQ5E4F3_9ASTR